MSQDRPTIKATNIGLVAGRDANLEGHNVAGRDLYIYEGPAYPRLAYRREVGRLLAFYTEVFVGRRAELDRLVEFAAQSRPGYLLVEGAPAFGKSALAAQLVDRHETNRWPGPPPALIYFFIREEGKWHTPGAFCSAINSQLLDMLGERGGVPSDLQSQRNQLLSLWTRAKETAGPDRPLLLLVDGLDEQAPGEVTIAALLPSELGPYVHVAVTSRPNPEPLARVPVWHPLRQAEVQRLQSLRPADIERLLEGQGGADPHLARLAARVHEVTKGEPLLARFISQDVALGGEPALAALEQAPPAGVKDYFKGQLEQLDARAEGDTAWEVLWVLLVTHGAMTIGELAAVLELPVRQVRRAIAPIHRFLVGRDQLELMHIELQAVLLEQFTSPAERQAYRRRLLHWCASYYSDQGWLADTPDYVLRNYASHLYEVGDHDGLYRLVNRQWMELKAARTHSYQAFARDVLLAIDAANSENPPNFVEQVRGSLIYANLTSMATNLSFRLLAMLARLGQLSHAEGYAALLTDPEMRAHAYRQIALVLFEQGKLHDATSAIDQAVAAAQTMANGGIKAETLAEVAEVLVNAGQSDEALTIAHAILDEASRPGALAAGSHPDDGHQATSQAPIAIPVTSEDERRAGALNRLARALAEAGHRDQACQVADRALSHAHALANDTGKMEALTQVASGLLPAVAEVLANTGHPNQARWATDQALTAAQAIPDTGTKSSALVEVARALANTGQLDQALSIAQAIPDTGTKSSALAKVARALANTGQLDQALSIAQAIPDTNAKRWALGQVAEALAEAGHPNQALTIAQALPDSVSKSSALAKVATALPNTGQPDQALNFIQALPDSASKSWALAKVVDALTKTSHFDQALTSAQALPDLEAKARALAKIAEALARAGHLDQARRATDQALTAAHALPEDVTKGGVTKGSLLITTARALAWAGDLDQALTIVQALPSYHDHNWVLAELAEALANSGHLDQARRATDQALTAAQALPDDWTKSRALGQVAEALAEAGHLNQALNFALALPDSASKSWALAKVAEALANTGQPDQALVAAQAIVEDKGRAQALAEVAEALANSGHLDQARRATDQALTAAQAIPDSWTKSWALAKVAGALARAGHLDQARRATDQALTAAQAIPEDENRAQALAGVARALAEANHPNQALTMVQALPDDATKSWALAEALARAGQPDQALTATKAIPEDKNRPRALVGVTRALASTSHFDHALTIAQALPDDVAKSWALAGVAEALANTGQPDQALTIALALPDHATKSYALSRVVEALASTSHFDHALTIAQALPDHEAKARAVAKVATALGNAGQPDHALTITQALPDHATRIRALSQVAEALARAGHLDQARRATDQALTAAHALPNGSRKAEALTQVARAQATTGQPDEALTVLARSLTLIRVQGSSGFFGWLEQAATALSVIRIDTLISLSKAIHEVETWWTR